MAGTLSRVVGTASRIAEILGRRTAEISFHLHELVESGEVIGAAPWPAGLRGYQPVVPAQEAPLFALPEPISDERQWLLDELARWASLHGGSARRQIDWSKGRDPDGIWPRWDCVADFFEAEAHEKGVRTFVVRRCAPDCACSKGGSTATKMATSSAMGASTASAAAPHGDVGEWVGPSGWRYALQVAGFS